MKDKIEKLKLKNSEKIANAFLENNVKFNHLAKLYKDYKTLCKREQELMHNLLKIYTLSFKGLSSRIKLVGVIKNTTYSISPRGIVRRTGKVGTNNFDFYTPMPSMSLADEWILIGQNRQLFKKVLKKDKKVLIDDFFKDYTFLRSEPKVMIKLEQAKEIILLKEGFGDNPFDKMQIDSMSLDNSRSSRGDMDYEIHLFLNQRFMTPIQFSKLFYTAGASEKIFLEQIFTYVRELLLKESNNRKKEIKRLEELYKRIKDRFSPYIMLEAIEKANEGDKRK